MTATPTTIAIDEVSTVGRTTPPPPPIRRLRRPAEALTDDERLKRRILTLLARPATSFWQRPPMRYWRLRTRLGGGVRPDRLRRLLDELIAAGQVLELYEASGGRRHPRHLLLQADDVSGYDPDAVLEAIGRADVLERHGLTGQLPIAEHWP